MMGYLDDISERDAQILVMNANNAAAAVFGTLYPHHVEGDGYAAWLALRDDIIEDTADKVDEILAKPAPSVDEITEAAGRFLADTTIHNRRKLEELLNRS